VKVGKCGAACGCKGLQGGRNRRRGRGLRALVCYSLGALVFCGLGTGAPHFRLQNTFCLRAGVVRGLLGRKSLELLDS
jgi:hypothetical protein